MCHCTSLDVCVYIYMYMYMLFSFSVLPRVQCSFLSLLHTTTATNFRWLTNNRVDRLTD